MEQFFLVINPDNLLKGSRGKTFQLPDAKHEKDEQRMKILMTTDTIGAVWTYSMELCKALKNYDVEVHLVSMGAKMQAWQKEEIAALEHVVSYDTDYALEWMQGPWMDIKECGEWMLQLEDKIQADVIHLNCFAFGSLPFKAPVLVVAHSDVYSWFLTVKKDDPSSDWNPYYWCVKNGLKNANRVVAPSHAKMELVQKIYGVGENCKVIYNGRDPELFTSGPKRKTIFSMGRMWDEARNMKLIAEAAPLIPNTIRVAGDEHSDNKWFCYRHEHMQNLGRLSSVEIRNELSKAALYVLPARYEPFGLSALEAALSGCALVLGDIPSLREIWGDAAVFVDPENAPELAYKVNQLMEEDETRAEMAARALARARHYSARLMADSYFQCYQELLISTSPLLNNEAAA